MTGRIYVVPIHRPMVVNLQFLTEAITSRFGVPSLPLSLEIDLGRAHDRFRNQYHSTEILAQLLRQAPRDTLRILGLTDLDLFIPVLTYVFGEAQLGGKAAVVSCYRLKNELYGLPPDNRLLQARLLKEAIHELGHTFHLLHCDDPSCVMRVSTYVEEIDYKGDRFCAACEARLANILEDLLGAAFRKASF
ncbi:MAG: archaemetzincin family Zn-dependent metalloprotease [candidate division KSB1 bacterium]|nr:archaemetzincin family Zn-dependent metalloprotease [candidate division KSB1 bacterium]